MARYQENSDKWGKVDTYMVSTAGGIAAIVGTTSAFSHWVSKSNHNADINTAQEKLAELKANQKEDNTDQVGIVSGKSYELPGQMETVKTIRQIPYSKLMTEQKQIITAKQNDHSTSEKDIGVGVIFGLVTGLASLMVMASNRKVKDFLVDKFEILEQAFIKKHSTAKPEIN